jgi:Trk K+ transport system NAD-binding subunit
MFSNDEPIVVCGLGRVGARVLEYLRAAKLPVVVVDNKCKPDDPRLRGMQLVTGDCRDRSVLEKAGVPGARGVLVMTNDDLVNISTTLQVRALGPEVRVVLRLFDQNLLEQIGQAISNIVVLSTSMLTAPVLGMMAVTGAAMGAFRLEGQPEGARLVSELVVGEGDAFVGRTIAEVAGPARAEVLAHAPAGQTTRLLRDVDRQERLRPGDILVVCGLPRLLGPLVEGEGGLVEDLRWAGWLRRMLRVGHRTLHEMDRAVLICTAVLLFVLVISTAVLHLGVTKYSIHQALFRTVSIMATSAQMYDRDFDDHPRMQVFVSCLRIIGAVLLAAFTAIVTNYLLRARLGGALEVRRIPESGHIVVCGLGSIGFRTVEELLRFDERVVVIEKDPGSEFVSTTRRQGVPVLIGDATLREVQQQAQAEHAHALIAATSHDLSNLSVALLARRANPHQRVVVLISEPTLAGLLRQAASVELALSVPALVAPAFMAALFGDRVVTVLLVRGHPLAVVDLDVRPGDPLAGHTVEKLAGMYRMLPMGVHRSGQTTDSALPLLEGDRLAAVIALDDLEPLLGR